ncbi:hypothetical protein HN51_020221 [Arachis hypogaea]|uniref:uncharacterized protein n=1 Tax=Arachis hypogaea TaxID=3818 RepID=UPI003B217CED|nr:uncharacterized protein DS421_8g247220 [Arachis hypogaea]QHO32118.1 uncharacterized protein DS421_8g247220 [Arachis hypogaea]QHO32119.1 uncharacterized protein DS421_8g247220 [Arachis hypogaea]QHO32120.1 uncharacterized protein DS421_8g247220 [Arachis hypogaea]
MMESAETGECLWMVTNDYIFGIRVEKLEKLGKNEDRDWKSHLEQAPFDFCLNLPESSMLDYFIFDSKFFLVGKQTESGTKIYQISYVGGNTLGTSEAVETGAIPPLPTEDFIFLANIKDDVYLLEHGAVPQLGRKTGLWVLCPNPRHPSWHSAPAPPTEVNSDDYSLPVGFVLNDKFFLHPLSAPGIAYLYDPQLKAWIKLERTFFVPGYDLFVRVRSLGDVGDGSVVLTWKLKALPVRGVKYDIQALLVDNKDYCILRHQGLDELCEAIQPSFFDDFSSELNLVDLGNSKVCVTISGLAEGIPSFCILVVELGLVQEEQRFLSVRVLVNRVFDTRPYFLDDRVQVLYTSFLFSLRKGMPRKHPYSKDCISPRKEPKLAGGTNPSNPTTAFEQE